MALISVLLLLLIVSAATAALAVSGQTEAIIASNYEMTVQAQAAAEAGVSHAVDVTATFLAAWEANGFASAGAAMTSLLLGPDGQAGTAPTDADNGSLENFGIPRPPGALVLAGVAGAGYRARVFDDDDPARGLTLTAADEVRIGEDGQATNGLFTDLSTAVERSGSAPGLGPSEWDEQWPTSVSGAASVRRACRVLAEGPI